LFRSSFALSLNTQWVGSADFIVLLVIVAMITVGLCLRGTMISKNSIFEGSPAERNGHFRARPPGSAPGIKNHHIFM
jgi:hypothetical protein